MKTYEIHYENKLGIKKIGLVDAKCVEKARKKFFEEYGTDINRLDCIDNIKDHYPYTKQISPRNQGIKRDREYQEKRLLKRIKDKKYTKEITIDKDSKEYKKYLKRTSLAR